VVPTPPTFAATTSAIELSKTNSGSFLQLHSKAGKMTKTEDYTILLIASMEKNELVGTITIGYCKSFERNRSRSTEELNRMNGCCAFDILGTCFVMHT
jgi:hypothetical protein